jgi:hypothetical protein
MPAIVAIAIAATANLKMAVEGVGRSLTGQVSQRDRR